MNSDYRQRLLAILAWLDQRNTDAEAILADSADSEKLAMAEELCELLADMRALVEAKLERASQR